MITIKTPEDITALREGGKRLAEILEKVKERATPGVTTKELDKLAESLIFSAGGKSAFKNYKPPWSERYPFPATLCTSVNDEIVHGIPSHYTLREGDTLGLDIGLEFKGLFTDMAQTIPVGEISEKKQKLLAVTKQALVLAIAQIKEGAYLHDIGATIQLYVQHNGFNVVSKELSGHGIGHKLHEEPLVSNWRESGRGPLLKTGYVFAIEPMVASTSKILFDRDGWVCRTADGSPAAHFEHTVVVTKEGAEILTKI